MLTLHARRLGVIHDATLRVAPLTVVCGENNTGKTYLTYALYGVLRGWRPLVQQMVTEWAASVPEIFAGPIDLQALFIDTLPQWLEKLSTHYTQQLSEVFAFKIPAAAHLALSSPPPPALLEQDYQEVFYKASEPFFTLRKPRGSTCVEFLSEQGPPPLADLHLGLARAVADLVFAPLLPRVFISSAERTGVVVFRREVSGLHSRREDARGVGYAWPIQDNIAFHRDLEFAHTEGPLAQAYPSLLASLEALCGGAYRVDKDFGFTYHPTPRARISLRAASSAARALMDLSFYLRWQARVGDLVMIDEPELNLHPKNQRALARFLAQLVNVGVSVFMTTHSDYIVKEFNNLLLLGRETPASNEARRAFGYQPTEGLKPSQVTLYITTQRTGPQRTGFTLRDVPFDPSFGFETSSFDDTIHQMNELQQRLIYGE